MSPTWPILTRLLADGSPLGNSSSPVLAAGVTTDTGVRTPTTSLLPPPPLQPDGTRTPGSASHHRTADYLGALLDASGGRSSAIGLLSSSPALRSLLSPWGDAPGGGLSSMWTPTPPSLASVSGLNDSSSSSSSRFTPLGGSLPSMSAGSMGSVSGSGSSLLNSQIQNAGAMFANPLMSVVTGPDDAISNADPPRGRAPVMSPLFPPTTSPAPLNLASLTSAAEISSPQLMLLNGLMPRASSQSPAFAAQVPTPQTLAHAAPAPAPGPRTDALQMPSTQHGASPTFDSISLLQMLSQSNVVAQGARDS